MVWLIDYINLLEAASFGWLATWAREVDLATYAIATWDIFPLTDLHLLQLILPNYFNLSIYLE